MQRHLDSTIRHYTSDIVLNIHSDALYLMASKVYNRIGGYYFLGSIPSPNSPIKLNSEIHFLRTILQIVAIFAAEVEFGALFPNTEQSKMICLTLNELGDSQPPIPIHIDNTMVMDIVNNTIKHPKS